MMRFVFASALFVAAFTGFGRAQQASQSEPRDIIELATTAQMVEVLKAQVGKPVALLIWDSEYADRTWGRVLQRARKTLPTSFATVSVAYNVTPRDLATLSPDFDLPKPWYCLRELSDVPGLVGTAHGFALLDERGQRLQEPTLSRANQWRLESDQGVFGMPVAGGLSGDSLRLAQRAWSEAYQATTPVLRLDKAIAMAWAELTVDRGPEGFSLFRPFELKGLAPFTDVDGWIASDFGHRIPVRVSGFVGRSAPVRVDTMRVTGKMIKS